MNSKVHYIPVIIFGSVVSLLLSVTSYPLVGSVGVMTIAATTFMSLGLFVGTKWPLNAWLIGLLASVPCWIFLAWRLGVSTQPEEIFVDQTLFVFIPSISMATTYLGSYLGRWILIRQKQQSVLKQK